MGCLEAVNRVIFRLGPRVVARAGKNSGRRAGEKTVGLATATKVVFRTLVNEQRRFRRLGMKRDAWRPDAPSIMELHVRSDGHAAAIVQQVARSRRAALVLQKECGLALHELNVGGGADIKEFGAGRPCDRIAGGDIECFARWFASRLDGEISLRVENGLVS